MSWRRAGFALKVERCCSYGFAAGCEAAKPNATRRLDFAAKHAATNYGLSETTGILTIETYTHHNRSAAGPDCSLLYLFSVPRSNGVQFNKLDLILRSY